MSSSTASYTIPTFTGLFGAAPLVRDAGQARDELAIDAQARSGDYFVTLASRLDAMGRDANDYELSMQLENIVSDLIYMQDAYEITRKEEK